VPLIVPVFWLPPLKSTFVPPLNLVVCEQGSCAKSGATKIAARHKAIVSFFIETLWLELLQLIIYTLFTKKGQKNPKTSRKFIGTLFAVGVVWSMVYTQRAMV